MPRYDASDVERARKLVRALLGHALDAAGGTLPVAFDCSSRRPGCPILQANLGGLPSVASVFPDESWLLAPTPGLRLYRADLDQLAQLVLMTQD